MPPDVTSLRVTASPSDAGWRNPAVNLLFFGDVRAVHLFLFVSVIVVSLSGWLVCFR